MMHNFTFVIIKLCKKQNQTDDRKYSFNIRFVIALHQKKKNLEKSYNERPH